MPAPAAAAAPADAVALPIEQLDRSLWDEPGQRVYALVLGERVADLEARLQADGARDWDWLASADADADAEADAPARAPAVVALARGSALAGWLARQARADVGAWGVFALSARPYLAVRAHARALCEAVLPDGTAVRLDWMDPEILHALLAAATAPQLRALFSAFDAIVEPGEAAWTRWSLSLGALATRATPLRAAGP